MRILLVFMFAVIVSVHSRAQGLEDISRIAFIKQTRGFLDEVVVSRDSVHGATENHRMPESARNYASAIGSDDWAELMIALKDVPLEDIDGLQSPTMNRAHDGALHARIEITLKDGSTITHSFDDENPHPDLKPLLDALLQFRAH